MADCVQNSRL